MGLTSEEIDRLLNGLCAIARQHPVFYLWRPVAHDPDDDFLIDLAVEAQADFIISYNQRDLKPAEKLGIMIVTPQEFLRKMGEIK